MMDKKILFVLHVPPPVHGSSLVGKYIKESSRINSHFNCRFINLGTSLSVDEIGQKGFIKLKRYLTILWKVLTRLIHFRPHLLYLAMTAKGPAFYKDSVIAFMAKISGIKLVIHFHNKGIRTRQDKWLDNLLYKLVFKNTEVILLSGFLYPDVQKYAAIKNIHYCANGIPDTMGDSNHKGDRGGDRVVNILFLSNLIESKGIFLLLEACRLLQKKRLPFHCTVVGDEGDISANRFQEKVNEMGLSSQVTYAGRKFGPDKEEALMDADIFTLPTWNDCFPLVLLEAMRSGLPVVSTFEGGIPDVIEDGVTGFLVKQKDVPALAGKIESLIENPGLREKMGMAGRKRYEEHYTLDHFENRLHEILSAILAGTHPS